MRSDSLLIREDGKRFKVKYLAHWSEVEAADGETDLVKWYGENLYISADKGVSYKMEDS